MLRVINWNISYQGSAEGKLVFLKSVTNEVNGKYPCIIALQEVTRKAYLEISNADIFNNQTYSLHHRQPGSLKAITEGWDV